MKNVHERSIAAPIERVRPWIAAVWSGSASDPFPRDVLESWRRNPPGVDPSALVPNVTLFGHGPFAFRFESWDGTCLRLRIDGSAFRGWHGLELRREDDRTRVTYTLDVDASASGRALWSIIRPAHDWCVEAVLDRVEQAALTGEVPAVTQRKVPRRAKLTIALLRRAGRRNVRRAQRSVNEPTIGT